MRIIALDVHHSFARTATLENGTVWDAVKGDLDRGHLLRFTKMSSF
jgi:transposase